MVIKVLTGPMFSRKSEEMIVILSSATYTKKIILVVKPDTDTRKTRDIFVMIKDHRNLKKYPHLFTEVISSPADLRRLVSEHNPDLLVIEEAQFLKGRGFVKYISKLARDRKADNFTIWISGLDMDAWGKPFGIMPHLMAIADEVIKRKAVCIECMDDNSPAVITQKLSGSSNQIEVGDEIYGARCRKCHKL